MPQRPRGRGREPADTHPALPPVPAGAGRPAAGAARSPRTLGLVVGLLLLPLVAHAEPPAIDAQAFKPSPFFEDLFTVGKAEVPSPYLWNFGLMANYQNDPLVLRMDGKQVRSVLTHQLTGDLLVAGRLGDWFAFGAALPVILYQSGEGLPGGSEPRPVGIGDLRIYPRLHLLRLLADRFALAFTPILSLPTGQLVDPFMGRPNATLLPELEASFDLGGAGVAFDLGWLITENQTALNLDLVDELKFKLGGWFDLTERFTLIGEVAGATPITAPLAEITEAPLEFLGGGRYRLLPGLDLRFGAGAGTTTGYASPDFRLFAGLQRGRPLPTAPPPPVGDRDGDGLVDAVDRCPDDPEDRDDFQDEDGCPDPDNDGDGVLDGADRCPTEKETINGVADDDGCPDQGESRVRVTTDKVEILDRVYFDTAKDTLQERSFGILRQVATTLKAHPEIRRVRVEGHTDNQGDPEMNVDLSERRARRVAEFLLGEGVQPDQLESRGYGAKVPIDSNKTTTGRANNRRVEFLILEGADSSAVQDPQGASR